MSDLVRYVKEGREIRSRDQARQIIEELKQKLLEGSAGELEKTELVVTLAFSCVETQGASWDIFNHFEDNSDFELLSSIAEKEALDDDKRCRILSVVELIRRLR
jgi:hypothetical protein